MNPAIQILKDRAKRLYAAVFVAMLVIIIGSAYIDFDAGDYRLLAFVIGLGIGMALAFGISAKLLEKNQDAISSN